MQMSSFIIYIVGNVPDFGFPETNNTWGFGAYYQQNCLSQVTADIRVQWDHSALDKETFICPPKTHSLNSQILKSSDKSALYKTLLYSEALGN